MHILSPPQPNYILFPYTTLFRSWSSKNAPPARAGHVFRFGLAESANPCYPILTAAGREVLVGHGRAITFPSNTAAGCIGRWFKDKRITRNVCIGVTAKFSSDNCTTTYCYCVNVFTSNRAWLSDAC